MEAQTDSITAKDKARAQLASLIGEYNATLRTVPQGRVSEETVRAWLNEFLGIFGWDVRNVKQVWQEAALDESGRERLASINSTHKRPDYTLLNGSEIKTFLDAKSPSVDIFTSKAVAFQVRSYGWSAQVPCAFASNFAQTAIFDTRFRPDNEQDAAHGAIQIPVDDYLEKFDVLFEHLWRGNVVSNGLESIYSAPEKDDGRTLDGDFVSVLTAFRLKLAVELARRNPSLASDATLLNYYVQVIMDRIVFIRVCEARGIEDKDRLREFQQSVNGFWQTFRESCYMEFFRHYDGAMFDRDARFNGIELPDEVFADFIDELYYPSPYRFDVIPAMVLAKIYEEFLGRRLAVRRGKVVEEIKGEYVKTNGAIPTPEHIVRLVCDMTLSGVAEFSKRDLLGCRILDPCCGSGTFLVACYDILEAQFIRVLKEDADFRREHDDFSFSDESGNWLLTIPGRRFLVKNFLFGIDVDEAAVEVSKMSLALKVIDGCCISAWDSLGANGDRLLRDIGENIRLGNTLVPLDSKMGAKTAGSLRAFEPAQAFPAVFCDGKSGFSYIVCNPPYVETKFFKDAQPALHSYLTRHYEAYEGKADLAVLFIERCLQLLADDGKSGFIVQRRWFRTDYGKGIRRLINSAKALGDLMEFEATDIFPQRITYVAVMTLAKIAHEMVSYCRIAGNGDAVKTICGNGEIMRVAGEAKLVPHPIDDEPWDFAVSDVSAISDRLLKVLGRFDAFPGLAIKDGIQALWKKVYHLRDVEFQNDAATGVNGFGETVRIERDILRGVVYNREFYPFKDIQPDAWCIFPYEGASADAIEYSDIKARFPLAYEYLERNRLRIQKQVECRSGEKWHTFTREHNHGLYNVDKIIVPMTARDTIATFVDGGNGLYMDNANVWFVCVDGASRQLQMAIAGIINSTVFSVLAKQKANPQSGGYYKFNKQFLAPVPFPSERLIKDGAAKARIAALADKIHAAENRYLSASANQRGLLAQQLGMLWERLDGVCEALYGLTRTERAAIRTVGRTINRVELLPK